VSREVLPDRQEQPRQLGRPGSSGLCGGLFVDRAEALKFAMFENGNRPQAVIMVPGILELDMSAQPRDQNRSTAGLHAPLARAA
jgi:hypothetical protein